MTIEVSWKPWGSGPPCWRSASIRWPSWAADSLATCSRRSGTIGQQLWSNHQMRPPPNSVSLLCLHLVGWSQPLGEVVVPDGKF